MESSRYDLHIEGSSSVGEIKEPGNRMRLGFKDYVCLNFWANYSSIEIYAIMPPKRQIGYKKSKLSCVNPERKVDKTVFWNAVAWVVA
jgi:hypothetical protein